jgi:5-methyltetrahydrofolate--homocysteine methyltransferase
MTALDDIKEATIAGHMDNTVGKIEQALSEGMSPGDIIQNGLIEAMGVVGKKFKNNEIYVSEMLIAARAMKSGLSKLKPLMVEGAGMKVFDVGVDISPEKFVEAVKKNKPQFVGMSALLTTTMPSMKETLEALEEAGVRGDVKVLVGGAPVTQKFADEIGADGYADNAAEVVDKIKAML